MAGADPALVNAAQNFADDLADLLQRTITDDPPIRAEVRGDRVVVSAFDNSGETVALPLMIAREHHLDLRVFFRCTFDFTGAFLAIEQSEVALILPAVRSPVVRFDYVRDRAWAAAHVQLHAESSAIGYLRALAARPPETWRLHLPVGGRRFRPSLEDVIEFTVREFGVETRDGWMDRLQEGRVRWRRLQAKAAIRDTIKDDPEGAPDDLHRTVDDARRAVIRDSGENP